MLPDIRKRTDVYLIDLRRAGRFFDPGDFGHNLRVW